MLVSSTTTADGYEKIDVLMVDSNGVPCLDSRKEVRFELAGDGELIKNQGTASGSSKVGLANGRASIRMKKGNGKSVVAVKSDGLDTQFITIN